MALEIKTKDVVKSAVRTADNAAKIGNRMKSVAVKTKEQVQQHISAEDDSPTEYASSRVYRAGERLARKGAEQFNQKGVESVEATRKNISKAADAMETFKVQRAAKATQRGQAAGQAAAAQSTAAVPTFFPASSQTMGVSIGQSSAQAANPVSQHSRRISHSGGIGAAKRMKRMVSRPIHNYSGRGTTVVEIAGNRIKTAQAVADTTGTTATAIARTSYQTGRTAFQTVKTSQKAYRTVQTTTKSAVQAVKATIQSAFTAIRTIAVGTNALITAIFAGGWIVVMIVLVMVLFGGAISLTGGNGGTSSAQPVSAEVLAYEPLIRQYATQYGIPEYIDLIKAVMMQESGGQGGDPMQASEGAYNTSYPKSPNGITDPEYSISCGVQELKHCLEKAGVENPIDMDHIRLALQGYNYGDAYITWAVSNYSGYSITNAITYSNMMAQSLGWSSYGDPDYVSHVLRYYPYGHAITGVGDQAIVEIALTQLGNVGGQPYWSWYGFNSRVSWCACFVSWCADQCGYIDSGIIPKFASCQSGADWFKSHGQWKSRDYTPTPGDIIFFDWNGDGHTEHVGIVEKVENGTVYTVEGNSSNKCAQRHYQIGSSDIYGYGVPAY